MVGQTPVAQRLQQRKALMVLTKSTNSHEAARANMHHRTTNLKDAAAAVNGRHGQGGVGVGIPAERAVGAAQAVRAQQLVDVRRHVQLVQRRMQEANAADFTKVPARWGLREMLGDVDTDRWETAAQTGHRG